MTLELPAPADALEADYQALLQLLEAREAERQTQQDRRYQDMCDYYTARRTSTTIPTPGACAPTRTKWA